MNARVSRLASIRSAIRFRMLARYAGDVLFQLMPAAYAASRALSMSSWVERATSQSGLPVIGVGFTKYCPRTGGTYSPAIQLSYRARMGTAGLKPDAASGRAANSSLVAVPMWNAPVHEGCATGGSGGRRLRVGAARTSRRVSGNRTTALMTDR